MLDTMAEVRSHLGAPDSDDDEDKEEGEDNGAWHVGAWHGHVTCEYMS